MISQRISTLQSLLSPNTAAFITSGSNRFYFTGLHTSAGHILITKNSATFFTDFRYFEKAKNAVKECRVLQLGEGLSAKDVIKNEEIKTLFIETESMSISECKKCCEMFEGTEISQEDFLDTALKDMRAQKSEAELNCIRKAQEITDKTFEYICPRIEKGRSECEIMLDMEFFMRGCKSEGVAFDFIVVSGKNTSLPHGVAGDKKIENGDFVTMDFGAVVGGYRSDMTRTVAVGFADEEQQRVYETVLKAQTEALGKIKAGIHCCEIDKIARDIIYSASYKGCFGHSLGHSVGIDIHESPNFSPNSKEILKVGNVMTVEPGIYIENKFGVRIEDMVFVGSEGAENITKSPKKLMIL